MAKATNSPSTKNGVVQPGQKLWRLTAIEFVRTNEHRQKIWRFRCDCGQFTESCERFVRIGDTKSCGCLKLEILANAHRIHGKWKSAEFKAWDGIKERCTNPNARSYADYGGRGIAICDRWAQSFQNFLDDMGPKPTPAHSIERIDVNGNYCPENCRWATSREQTRNRRTNRFVMLNGQRMVITDACALTGVAYSTVVGRVLRGWDMHRALTEPPMPGRGFGKSVLASTSTPSRAKP